MSNSNVQHQDNIADALVVNSVDAIIAINPMSRVTLWNPAAEKMFGFQQSAVLGQDIAELIIPPVYRKDHYKGLQRVLSTGQGTLLNKTIEIVAQRKNGEIFPIELSLFQIRIGEAPQFTAIIRDISDRKGLEQELQDKNKQLDDLLQVKVSELAAAQKKESLSKAISELIRNEIGLDNILKQAVDRVGQFAEADRCFIWLVDPDRDVLKAGRYEYLRVPELPSLMNSAWFNVPILPQIIHSTEVIQIPDVAKSPELTEQDRQMIHERQVKSLVHIPILYREKILGCFRLHTVYEKKEWNEETLAKLEVISNHIGAAIYQAQLLEASLEKERKLHAVFDLLPEGIAVFDKRENFVDVNQAFCRLVDLRKEDIIGKVNPQIFDPVSDASFLELSNSSRPSVSITMKHSGQTKTIAYRVYRNFYSEFHLLLLKEAR